jgi:hypothetical protein
LFQWENKATVISEVKGKDDRIGTITGEGRKEAKLGNLFVSVSCLCRK